VGTGTAAVPVPTANFLSKLPSAVVCFGLAAFFVVFGAKLRFWDFSPTGVVFFTDIAFLDFYWWVVIASFLFIILFLYKMISRFVLPKVYKTLLNKRVEGYIDIACYKKINKVDFLFFIIFVAVAITGFILLMYFLPIESLDAQDRRMFLDFIIGRGRLGSDYYGLFPFVGFFLAGAGVGLLFYYKKKSLIPKLHGRWAFAYSTIGKHGLLIYIIHMVIIFAAIILIAMIAGYRFW